MPLVVIFIIGAVIIGSGAMLAPAWPTKQPRIGMNATFALAVVITGALFYAFAFGGWNALIIDYLLFALVTSIFLFGTLTFGQKRAEREGGELLDEHQGWPGPSDLLFFALAALIFIVPVLVLPVPLDTDAQGFGYLALTARLGDSFTTLTPFHPEISYLYSPGFIGLSAYISEQLKLGLQDVQFGISAVLCLLFVMLAYDFGSEIRDKRLGRAMGVAALLGIGLFTAFMDSHFTTIMALNFALACFLFSFRYIRDGHLVDALAAGLMFGSTAIVHPDTFIILMLGFAPWLATMWLGRPKPTLRRWLVIAVGVPVIGVLAVSPWLLAIRPLLGQDITSPFERSLDYWKVMILYHGILIVPLAFVGIFAGLRERSQAAILSTGMLIFALDFAALGVVETLFGWLLEPVLRYDYPFSIAWHAPIIPYTLLGGIGLLWLFDWATRRWPAISPALRRSAPYALASGIVIVIALGLLAPSILPLTRGIVPFYGAFSSEADVTAMEWLRNNTPADARILNYSQPHEADWAPVISERDTVYYRPQPFFHNDEASLAEQQRLRAFWQNPADPANQALLQEAGVDYVLVPQIISNPDSSARLWRWRDPFVEPASSAVADAPYLTLIFDADGAQVYQVGSG